MAAGLCLGLNSDLASGITSGERELTMNVCDAKNSQISSENSLILQKYFYFVNKLYASIVFNMGNKRNGYSQVCRSGSKRIRVFWLDLFP